MAEVRRILNGLAARIRNKQGVSSAEYAVLAVGIIVMVGAAVLAFDLNNPMIFAGNNLLNSQSALTAAGR